MTATDADDTGRFRRIVESSVDDLERSVGGLSERERELARTVSHLVAASLPTLLRGRPDLARVAALETRADHHDAFRADLTGAGDPRDGRLGRMDRRIEDQHSHVLELLERLRQDVGTADERKQERAAVAVVNGVTLRVKVIAGSIISLILGGAGLAVWRSHADSVASSTRTDERLHRHDLDLDRLYNFCRAPRLDPEPARTP